VSRDNLNRRWIMGAFTYRLPHEPFRKPSKNEEEYFCRGRFAERRTAARQEAEARSSEDRLRLRELHQNRCPRCGEKLEHIRIKKAWADQCPVCEGVWLDRKVFCILTNQREQPLAAMFRWILVDQCLGDMRVENEDR
jgi:predicted Zn-ribbon and HTH transcriptional regulator